MVLEVFNMVLLHGIGDMEIKSIEKHNLYIKHYS